MDEDDELFDHDLDDRLTEKLREEGADEPYCTWEGWPVCKCSACWAERWPERCS